MSRVVEVVFARSGCAFILGSVGGLIGLVSWGAWTAQSDYPRSPSSIVWAFVGGTFGFVLGACMGSRRLTGRRGWLVSGLVAGMLLGALIGSIQAHAEYGFAREQLLQAGLPVMFIDAAEGGLSVRGFETIGLQYGICLGILAGATAGWFWNHPPRFSPVANLFPVLASCFVALSMIAMHSGFRDLSTDVIGRVGRSWRACKSPKVSDDSRPGPELNPESQAHSVRRRFHSIPSSAWNRTSRSSASRRTKGQCRSPLARRRAREAFLFARRNSGSRASLRAFPSGALILIRNRCESRPAAFRVGLPTRGRSRKRRPRFKFPSERHDICARLPDLGVE